MLWAQQRPDEQGLDLHVPDLFSDWAMSMTKDKEEKNGNYVFFSWHFMIYKMLSHPLRNAVVFGRMGITSMSQMKEAFVKGSGVPPMANVNRYSAENHQVL